MEKHGSFMDHSLLQIPSIVVHHDDLSTDLLCRHMKASLIRCGAPTTTTQVMARKKRRGVIEKRRRDRINSSLSELRRLVPTAFEKQGSAKLEKAEILQMTVDHLKMLQATGGKGNHNTTHSDSADIPQRMFCCRLWCLRVSEISCRICWEGFIGTAGTDLRCFCSTGYLDAHALALDFLSLGFRECVTEVSCYLSAMEGLDSSDPLRSRLLSHLSSCASQRDAAALTAASRLQPQPLPPPFHPHHWAAAVAALRPLPYGLSTLPVSPDAAGGSSGAPQRLVELSQHSVTSSTSSSPSSSSSSLMHPCTPTPLSGSLFSFSASFPIALHGGIPFLPPSALSSTAATTSPPISSSSSSQTPHSGTSSSSSKPYRPWGTEVGAF
ncbi:hypothetical protein GOODEAATRI_008277 [Goodea atripinnis]|uniref:Hairy/enhancer-of-split related with YRPW motif-like protein n=1 Tax=Goodea atripinnis TaxID=208336 RepID=A0ABV0NKW6_9TELE